jgi:hypothetical protein
MSDTPPSRIEQLPNEIFLEIFSYAHHLVLCRAWAGLNFRIDSILRSVGSCFYLWDDINSIVYALYLQKWAEIITSLVDTRIEWAEYMDNNFIDIQPIDLRPFVNLRKYSQRCDVEGQLKQISPGAFPYLERLHFGDYSSRSTHRLRILFDAQFPFLISVSGLFLSQIKPNDTTINTIIRHIVITCDYGASSLILLTNFIKRLPNLITLRVEIRRFEETSPPSNITTKIRNMSIWLVNQTTLDEIEFLLQISCVTRLYLEIGSERLSDGSDKPCDFVLLAQILNSCQTLKHVELRVWRIAKQFNIEQIRQLSPWFASLDLAYTYQRRKSLQTFDYRFISKHIQF